VNLILQPLRKKSWLKKRGKILASIYGKRWIQMPTDPKSEIEVVSRPAQETRKTERQLVAVSQHYSGPIPPASEFAKYEKVLPGSADRIIAMAETSLKGQIRNTYFTNFIEFVSVFLGKFFVYFLAIVSVYLLMRGKEVAALLTGLGPIATALVNSVQQDKKKTTPKKKAKNGKKK
jgi:uncharacterized membrane protein